MDPLLKPLAKNKKLEPGTVVRRIGGGKDQQGGFLEYDDEGNIILINIVDMKANSLCASRGVLKPKPGDKLYYYDSTFDDSLAAKEAIKIIKNWPLFQEHRDLRDQILNFISTAYVPEQIIEMSNAGSLAPLSVPVQEQFRIGRFSERRNPDRICNEIFLKWLETLKTGYHITYVALTFQQKQPIPRFYTIGTKPHEETAKLLRDEEFNFPPNRGGHIKATGMKEGKKHFLVDAGSNFFGRGIHTPLHVSEEVVRGLKKVFPELDFTPVEGRGAFGTEQSY